MEKAKRRLWENRGETIAETLISVLIGALALVMLAGSITSSSNLVNRSKHMVSQYIDLNEKLVERPESLEGEAQGHMGSTTISFTEETGWSDEAAKMTIQPVEVTYYQNETFQNKPVVMYHLHRRTGTGRAKE